MCAKKKKLYDDGFRQYSLDLWLKGYLKGLDEIISYIHYNRHDRPRCPSLSDYPDTEEGFQRYVWAYEVYERTLAQIDERIEKIPLESARRWVVRGTDGNKWSKTRKIVWERDKGICYICQRKIELDDYECGHIVDRVMGGSDLPENCVVMCGVCNRAVKDLHATRAEFEEWVLEIRKTYLVRMLRAFGRAQDK